MSFPANPQNGATATVNNISYVYSSTSNSWTRNPTNGILTASNFYYPTGESPGYVYLLDDISTAFDGTTRTFNLSVNGTAYAPNSIIQLTIAIGEVPVFPARYINDYQNLTEINLFNSGYSISGSTITFATAPIAGMNFYGTVRTNSDPVAPFLYTQTPFKALNIMLGA